jgi:hypothetical protein
MNKSLAILTAASALVASASLAQAGGAASAPTRVSHAVHASIVHVPVNRHVAQTNNNNDVGSTEFSSSSAPAQSPSSPRSPVSRK